jgi:metal-responsive CopG/Arc/MetJ family transcriptional regulator
MPLVRTSVRKIMTLPADLLQEIEEYRTTLHPIPSQSEAIRRLIRLGLETASGKRSLQLEPRQ